MTYFWSFLQTIQNKGDIDGDKYNNSPGLPLPLLLTVAGADNVGMTFWWYRYVGDGEDEGGGEGEVEGESEGEGEVR